MGEVVDVVGIVLVEVEVEARDARGEHVLLAATVLEADDLTEVAVVEAAAGIAAAQGADGEALGPVDLPEADFRCGPVAVRLDGEHADVAGDDGLLEGDDLHLFVGAGEVIGALIGPVDPVEARLDLHLLDIAEVGGPVLEALELIGEAVVDVERASGSVCGAVVRSGEHAASARGGLVVEGVLLLIAAPRAVVERRAHG